MPTHVVTPAGERLALRGQELQREISECCGTPVEALWLKHGIFDDAAVSLITLGTIAGIGRPVAMDLDPRRFRANIVLETEDTRAFAEDDWVGGTVVFGETEPRPAVTVTAPDLRCMMINLDPETARQDPRVMKSVAWLNASNAGVYATVVRTGTIHVGQTVSLLRR